MEDFETFSKYWEIAIFLLGGLLLIPLIPFFLFVSLWESLQTKWTPEDE